MRLSWGTPIENPKRQKLLLISNCLQDNEKLTAHKIINFVYEENTRSNSLRNLVTQYSTLLIE